MFRGLPFITKMNISSEPNRVTRTGPSPASGHPCLGAGSVWIVSGVAPNGNATDRHAEPSSRDQVTEEDFDCAGALRGNHNAAAQAGDVGVEIEAEVQRRVFGEQAPCQSVVRGPHALWRRRRRGFRDA